MEEVKNENVEEVNVEANTVSNEGLVVVKESIGKKILKIGLKVLAGAAAVVAGVFIGRATNKGGDDSDETNQTTDSDE